MSRVLLLRVDSPASTLAILPALRVLRNAAPGTQIQLVCSATSLCLFEHEPGVRATALPKNWKRMPRHELLHALGAEEREDRYDAVVSLCLTASADIDALIDCIPTRARYSVSRASPLGDFPADVQPIEFSPDVREDESESVIRIVLQALGIALPVDAQKALRAPALSPADRAEAAEKMGDKHGLWLGICPLTSSRRLAGGQRRWRQILRSAPTRLPAERVFLFGTPADYRVLEGLQASAPPAPPVDLCFPSSFRALAAYFERTDAIVAVDTGPLELARALGTPCMGILSRNTDTPSPARGGEVLVRPGLLGLPSRLGLELILRRWSPLPSGAD